MACSFYFVRRNPDSLFRLEIVGRFGERPQEGEVWERGCKVIRVVNIVSLLF